MWLIYVRVIAGLYRGSGDWYSCNAVTRVPTHISDILPLLRPFTYFVRGGGQYCVLLMTRSSHPEGIASPEHCVACCQH